MILASSRPDSGAPTALALLNAVFGYPEFRGEQGEIIEHVSAGGDALINDR